MKRIVGSFRNVLNRGFCRSNKKQMSGSAPEKQRTKNNGGLEKHKTWFSETVEITEVARSVPLITMRNNKLYFSENIQKNTMLQGIVKKLQKHILWYAFLMKVIYVEIVKAKGCWF